MWQPRYEELAPVALLAGASVLATVLTQWLSSAQSELFSELIAWSVLYLAFKKTGPTGAGIIEKPVIAGHSTGRVPPSLPIWAVAVCLAVASFCRAGMRLVVFFPALTPLLLVTQRQLGVELRMSKETHQAFFSPLATTVLGTAAVSVLNIVALSNGDRRWHLLSLIPASALLFVYATLSPSTKRRPPFLPHINLQDVALPLLSRIVKAFVAVVVVEMLVFGLPTRNPLIILLIGFAKATSWYCIILTTRHVASSWCIATSIGTFGALSFLDPAQSSETQALLHVAASVLTLGQVIYMLPTTERKRSILWLFALVTAVPYVVNILSVRSAQSAASSFLHSHIHPIEALARSAKLEFEQARQRQSTTYPAACDEYRRRYGVEPPPGFEAWYGYTTYHRSHVIDDFDTIYDSISPFWRLSGKQVLEIMQNAYQTPKSELWICAWNRTHPSTECTHQKRFYDRHFGFILDYFLGNLHDYIPEVKFLVNHFDEPTVLIPPLSDEGLPARPQLFNITDLSHQSSWDIVTKYCASRQKQRPEGNHENIETFGLPFVKDSSLSMDLCQHSEFGQMNALFMSPGSLRVIDGLVPVITTGAPSSMGDILIPSPAYVEPEFRYEAEHDVDWELKRKNLYWAGSNTGGFAWDDRWRQFQRQRFVEMVQNLKSGPHTYLRENRGVVEPVKSSFLNGRLYDVAFTRIFQCKLKYCRDQNTYFNLKGWADKDEALRSQLVFDIDGNGISGRYYKLLASKSTPLKQTIMREWHDDRLMPWVHYVPVSHSMEELPEIVMFLTSTEAGQRVAKDIADMGRDWFEKSFRDLDMSIYTYRLALELARLQDPARPAGHPARV